MTGVSALAQLAFFLLASAGAAQLEVLDVPGVTLRHNPLGDPAQRRVAILSPDSPKPGAAHAVVIYLPGWGGSSEDAITGGRSSWFASVVDELAKSGVEIRLAVVDGRSRYGGSQFLNSSATGRYVDYVADEILPLLKREPAETCVIAGHSEWRVWFTDARERQADGVPGGGGALAGQ